MSEEPTAAPMSDEEYERVTLAYWRARVPNLDSVSVTVRHKGAVARFIRIEATDGTVTTIPASSFPAQPAS